MRSDDRRTGAAAVFKSRDGLRAVCRHLSTGRMEVFNTELWAIALTLRKSVKEMDTLLTHPARIVAVFRDSQVAI